MKNLSGFWLGVVTSIIAVVFFTLMGLVIKMLAGAYKPSEIAAYRNVFGLVPSMIALWFVASWRDGGRPIRIRQWPLAVFRGVAVTGAQFCFYLSLTMMDFAAASTINYASAIITTAYAAPLFGEKVGPVRWGAVVLGFIGVALVMQPTGDDFSWAAILPLISAALYAITAVTSRLVDQDTPTPLFNLYSTSSAAIGAVIVTLATGGFTPIGSTGDMLWLIAMGGLGGCAVLAWVMSYRVADSSDLAPFNYLGIPVSFLFGWLAFGEAPFEALFPGGLLIAVSGLIIIWRERRRSHRNAARAAAR